MAQAGKGAEEVKHGHRPSKENSSGATKGKGRRKGGVVRSQNLPLESINQLGSYIGGSNTLGGANTPTIEFYCLSEGSIVSVCIFRISTVQARNYQGT
ncbi:unnamed protein product [Linum trigynum]|uniref:AT-hook motif nuclear-localized protein n=1 Tax=Linum trigynum TaxID=586398 RepID=A0AAV2GQQ5_9ROSI